MKFIAKIKETPIQTKILIAIVVAAILFYGCIME
jgi:hypothetical protein